jgi:Ca2+-transporting ATPase
VQSSANLAMDESPLTGEAEPQQKRPGDAGQVFAGSAVLAGQGRALVTTTGRSTRYGEIAALVEGDSSPTPLQRRTSRLVRGLALAAVAVAMAVALIQRTRGAPWAEALLAGVILAMAAVPEEFPLVFTLFLSVGAWRLGRRGVLVRRLAAVETLGSTTVVCTDKTGTLTVGRFTLDACVPLGVAEGRLLEAAILACERHPADPMEAAIVHLAESRGVRVDQSWALIRDHDFDLVGKHMSHVWRAGGSWQVAAKGALEGVLEHCAITPEGRAAAEAENERLAGEGMRVLAVAAVTRATMPEGSDRRTDERGLELVGLLGFRDPLRPEVRLAVQECQRAGVRLKLITGDHPTTARTIASAAGIDGAGAPVVTGPDLAEMSEPARRARIIEGTVFARISPAQKYGIVQVLEEAGEVVAMTGDGINDAPALRRADIGISMGARATGVARAAADMVLLEDDLGAIVSAMREGRCIFRDLQRAFRYLLAFHIPIVALAVVVPLLGLPPLLLPVHLVWLELVVHPVSALAFQGEAGERDPMEAPPRSPRAPLLPRWAVIRSTVTGGLLTAAVLGGYLLTFPRGVEHARAFAVAVLIFGSALLVVVEWRGDARTGVPSSLRFWALCAATVGTLAVALYLPAAAAVLRLAPLRPAMLAAAAGLAVAAVGWRWWGRGASSRCDAQNVLLNATVPPPGAGSTPSQKT